MSTGVPSLTTSPAAGIWLEIFLAGSGGCGDAWPSVSFLSRSAFSASGSFFPTIFGTVTSPLPTAISSETSESFSAVSPAAGVWPITVPGSASSVTSSFCCPASLSSASVSFCSASKADGEPTTSGTSTLRGSSMNRNTASAASSARTGISHHGSHAFWRNTPWEGSSGAAGAAAAPPPLRFLRLESWRFLDGTCGPRSCGPRSCGLRKLIPPGPMFTPGSYSCGLKTCGAPTPGIRRRPRRAAGDGPASAVSGSAASRSSASAPVSVVTSKRLSTARPTQICLAGLTRIVVWTVWPGVICAGGRSKPNCSSPSGSVPSSATTTAAFARFSTSTVKSALRRPFARWGRTLVPVSVYGRIPSASGADTASRLCAFECATTCRSQIRASASGVRGGCRWISTSCSYVPDDPNGTRYTVSGKIDHQPSGNPSTRNS